MAIKVKVSPESQLTQDEVIQFAANALGVSASRINADSTTGDIIEWDSMGILAILTALEREGIALNSEEFMVLQSMSGILSIFREAGRLK